MEIKLNYEELTKMSNQEIMDMLEGLTKFRLYEMSLGWRSSKEYILKAKGGQGDVIVLWNE